MNVGFQPTSITKMMMFEVPEAKRIKRSAFLAANSDGNSSDGSSGHTSRQVSPSRAEDHQIEIDYGFEYDFVSPPQDAQKPVAESGVAEEEKEEATYQFRLFNQTQTKSSSSPSSKELQVQQAIRLSSTPEPESFSIETARFVRPRRPESYHFTSALPEATQSLRRSQYEDVAVSTREVLLSASTTKWPGAALPWRVINITLNSTTTTTTKTKSPSSSTSRPKRGSIQIELSRNSSQTPSTRKLQPRPRPSKNRRILLRRQLAAKVEASQQQTLTDAAEREKRTRRNREKKLKRKEREKLKKEPQAAEPGSAAALVVVSSSSTGDETTVADSDRSID